MWFRASKIGLSHPVVFLLTVHGGSSVAVFFCASVVSYVVFVLSSFVLHPASFGASWIVLLHDCGTDW